jgi:hypothetical protein
MIRNSQKYTLLRVQTSVMTSTKKVSPRSAKPLSATRIAWALISKYFGFLGLLTYLATHAFRSAFNQVQNFCSHHRTDERPFRNPIRLAQLPILGRWSGKGLKTCQGSEHMERLLKLHREYCSLQATQQPLPR